jgi:hypothetical protein
LVTQVIEIQCFEKYYNSVYLSITTYLKKALTNRVFVRAFSSPDFRFNLSQKTEEQIAA